jgi:ZIP family zinc transporter
MGGHVFLDGVALGVAFQVSHALGYAVFAAILVHAFSDGLNTVSLLVKGGHWSNRGRWLLLVDAFARVGGAAIGSAATFNEKGVALYLAIFAGMVIYLATSHILPEAHSRHPSRLTLLATLSGVGLMWILVANLGMH